MSKKIEKAKKLNRQEKINLQVCEKRIRAGINTFFHDVGCALKEINDLRLYREDHQSFEDYCQQEWEMSRKTAYQLMAASVALATIRENVPDTMPLPSNEAQIRPLTSLPPSVQPKVWMEAVESSEGRRVTGSHVAIIAAKYKDGDGGLLPSPSASGTVAEVAVLPVEGSEGEGKTERLFRYVGEDTVPLPDLPGSGYLYPGSKVWAVVGVQMNNSSSEIVRKCGHMESVMIPRDQLELITLPQPGQWILIKPDQRTVRVIKVAEKGIQIQSGFFPFSAQSDFEICSAPGWATPRQIQEVPQEASVPATQELKEGMRVVIQPRKHEDDLLDKEHLRGLVGIVFFVGHTSVQVKVDQEDVGIVALFPDEVSPYEVSPYIPSLATPSSTTPPSTKLPSALYEAVALTLLEFVEVVELESVEFLPDKFCFILEAGAVRSQRYRTAFSRRLVLPLQNKVSCEGIIIVGGEEWASPFFDRLLGVCSAYVHLSTELFDFPPKLFALYYGERVSRFVNEFAEIGQAVVKPDARRLTPREIVDEIASLEAAQIQELKRLLHVEAINL